MDPETQKIVNTQNDIRDLVNHVGWKHARLMLTDKILELQNVSEYTDSITLGNATKLMKEMKANKRSAEILFDWLRQVEGEASTSLDNKKMPKEGFIVRL